jgi:hypothetical protein
MRLPLLTILVAIGATFSFPSFADVTKSQCVDSNSNGQSLRLDGKFDAARRELQLCTDPTCPAIVRTDCTQRVEELDRAQPTILFVVKDSAGADLSGVKVTLDGRPFVDRIEGTPLRVDPGEHAFTFTAAGSDPVTRTFVIREGEKNRRERIVVGSAQPPSPVSMPLPEVPPIAANDAGQVGGLGAQKIIGLTTGALGVAGLVVGTVFGILTFAAASDQNSDCSSSTDCRNRTAALSDHSTGSIEGAASTAAFIAGGALFATGLTLFFTSPKPNTEHPPSTTRDAGAQAVHGSRLTITVGGIRLQGNF